MDGVGSGEIGMGSCWLDLPLVSLSNYGKGAPFVDARGEEGWMEEG